MEFKKLDQLVDLRGKTAHNGWQPLVNLEDKTDITIHHSLTDGGDSYSFARHHVYTNGWHEIAYHHVILKDGTIEWNHDLNVLSYHVGNWNKQSVGICLVGDFRDSEPTDAQKKSLKELHDCLVKDMPNYKRTKGHNEYTDYTWKQCPCFDYKAVINNDKYTETKAPKPSNEELYRIKTGTFQNAEKLANAKKRLGEDFSWVLYEKADDLDFDPTYRIVTGTFVGKNVAEHSAQKLRDKYGWTVYVIKA